ncbi:LysR family transcriptional regulator [Aliisedimentitalea scapharcae]|uniref:LysR family transcriptional regulator n=1 Tax=Aliisedimentitalea scapharcae TaxID=1524259 RepID=A0ABZ2XM93_9RHOB
MKPIPITLRHLDYVIATADTGSTAAAARALNVSQPSVSLAIAKVEAHLGRALFARNTGQGVGLTSFGEHKLGEFRTLRSQAFETLSGEDRQRSVLTLGVFSTLGPRYAPGLVRGFLEEQPTADVRLLEADLETLAQWLDSGQIDVALIYEFGLPSTLELIPLADVRPYGVVSQSHRLAERSSVSLAELLQDPIILMNLPHSRAYFLSLAQVQGITPTIAYETGSVEMLRAMVANGLGVGVLATDIPHHTAYDQTPIVRLPLTGHLAPHRIALARSGRLRPSSLTTAFCRYTRRVFVV